ncbi:MAG: leukotoxin LktA family filamentous adhesin, partial [Janthinobacterium lividum]
MGRSSFRMRRSTRSLLCSTALLPVAVAGGAHSAWAQAVNLGTANGNMIIPDGRTATRLSGSGRTTDITTGTMSGGNAYNSFSHFKEAAGNTVNLHVPTGANYLVNVVRDSAVDIRGTLNSYKNGKIGGNVVFSDSYGFVVGKGGVVNTGGLTVVTPTKSVNEALIGKDGRVNDALAARAIRGDVPISPDGSVMIEGRVNAEHGVAITAHDIAIAGSPEEARKDATRRAQFESTVNAGGLREGGAIVVRNGSISIVATGDAKVAGTLTAHGAAARVDVKAAHDLTVAASAHIVAAAARVKTNVSGVTGPAVSLQAGNKVTLAGKIAVKAARNGAAGTLDVASGGDIAIAGTAKLSADGEGTGDGGHITVKAGLNTSVAAGATFSAAARGTGNGGFIEVSAVGRDSIATGTVFDLGAVSGRKGTLLFDPTDITIGGQSDVDVGTSATPSIYSLGGNVIIEASHSVTVAGTIDTRQYAGGAVTDLLSNANIAAAGDSGNITITAPAIAVANGAYLLADATGPYTAGNITLHANLKGGEAAISLGTALVAGHNI